MAPHLEPVFFIDGKPVSAVDRRPCPRTLDGVEVGWRVAAHLWKGEKS